MRILFVALPSGKPWNGNTIYNEPLGGSEACVAYMARALSRLGHAVTVYSHGQGVVADGVLYQNLDAGVVVHPETDVLVVSRWIEAIQQIETPLACMRVLWLHDMPYGNSRVVRSDAIFAVSRFQADAWRLSGQGVYVTADGVDTEIFRPVPLDQRNQNVLVWISNPDRGLPVAARIFQELRKRWPELELHVYGRSAVYGWEPSVEVPFLPQAECMENVFLHDALPRPKLASVLGNAWAMFYPTWWPETFCMAAMEAQACGTPVICSHVGALTETVMGGIIGQDFLNAVSQLRNPARWRKLSAVGMEWATKHSWENIARGWAETFEEIKCGLEPSRVTDIGAN